MCIAVLCYTNKPPNIAVPYIGWQYLLLYFPAVVDIVREVLELSRCRLGQGGKVLLQRMEQPWRWRARTSDCQSEQCSLFLLFILPVSTFTIAWFTWYLVNVVCSLKDLHRTGCSLFCGIDAEANQLMLKRVLLGYARWNKTIGYCQGFNMLAVSAYTRSILNA